MAIKPEIKEKILAAANALVAEGNENPTNEQVRGALGGKGSLSHISPVMREWRETRKADIDAALEMPSELKKAIEAAVGQVWTSASKLASVNIEVVRQEADEKVKAATSERDEAFTEITRLEERLEELQNQIRDKVKVNDQLTIALENERSNNAKLINDNAVLADRVARDDAEMLARLTDRQETIQSLKAELRDARNDNKQLQSELVEIAKKSANKK